MLALSATINLGHSPAGCGTSGNASNQKGLGLFVEPNVAGLAISADGTRLVAANFYNDSITVIDTAAGKVLYDYDLRPFATSKASDDFLAIPRLYARLMARSHSLIPDSIQHSAVSIQPASGRFQPKQTSVRRGS